MKNDEETKKSIEYGYCHCGCGDKTKIAKGNSPKCGYIKGKPYQFIRGHKGASRRNVFSKSGDKLIRKYRQIAMDVLGKSIPSNIIIHHFDCDFTNDKNKNLVICENNEYHHLLHVRQRALKACGDVHCRKCWICKEYDLPSNLYIAERGHPIYHKSCASDYAKKRYMERKESI